MFPDNPSSNDALETQQRVMLQQQEEELHRMKNGKSMILAHFVSVIIYENCIFLMPLKICPTFNYAMKLLKYFCEMFWKPDDHTFFYYKEITIIFYPHSTYIYIFFKCYTYVW